MHRAIPMASKACFERERNKEKELHKKKIRAMRPQVNTETPHVHHFDHLRNNLKKEQLLEERYHEIDRANRILLNKMSDIMKHPSSSSGAMQRSATGPPSLNEGRRKSELRRITQENQGILQRIRKAQPVLNHVEWEDSFRQSAGYLRNAAEYPIALPRKVSRPSSAAGLKPLEDAAPHSAVAPRAGSRSPAGIQAEEDLRYVLKEGKQLDKRYYLVEMSTDGRTLAISAYDGDRQRSLELIVNERNHRRLYRDTGGDYSAIASMLKVEGGQLVLEPNPGAGPFETQ
jgi:E3 ubiquitin-protein ligase TRIP12